ncbi:MAG: hypothetical protein JKY60_09820 [Kordiimonadaceae bacterium]|nr:hypothetical protein [Kordiimonadaceae bacterium]
MRKLTTGKPSVIQQQYLIRALNQPGGKLPLFDRNGQRIKDQTIRACIKKGWCETWTMNPIKPDWVVCKITDAGRAAAKVTIKR